MCFKDFLHYLEEKRVISMKVDYKKQDIILNHSKSITFALEKIIF